MEQSQLRSLCPGYFYAEAITDALIRDFKAVPLADTQQREAKLLTALDYGRTLLNVAEPLARAQGFAGAYDGLYQRIQNLVHPWRDDGKQHFIESPKVELVLDVLYEVQREVREVKAARLGLKWCVGCGLERTPRGKHCDRCRTTSGRQVAA